MPRQKRGGMGGAGPQGTKPRAREAHRRGRRPTRSRAKDGPWSITRSWQPLYRGRKQAFSALLSAWNRPRRRLS